MSHASRQEAMAMGQSTSPGGAPARYKGAGTTPVPTASSTAADLHHPHHPAQGLPPPQQLHLSRTAVIPQHPESPHQPQHPHQTGQQGPYASPHPSNHSLPPQHQSPYPAQGQPSAQPPQDLAYYSSHPSPYSTGSAPNSYTSSADTPELSMATATMNPRYPPLYHTPQSNSPSSVQSPQHDQHGRPIYGQPASAMPQGMYAYSSYQMPQQTQYSQHASSLQHNPMQTSSTLLSGQHGQQMQHASSHSHTPGLTGSPKQRLPQTPLQRPPSGLSASGTPQGPPSANSNVNPNAAPGPIPATTPLVVRQDQNGVQWIAFEYSRDRVKMEYTIRCDVESINVEELPQDFKTENCVYPRACCHKDQYKGNRLHYETECNTVGWALAQLNPCLRAKRGLIQRAVDSWRNSNQDPRLRSRRVRRMAKITSRKTVSQTAQHGPHMAAGAPGSAGVPNSAGLPGAPGQRPGMGMGGQIHHHHEHSGGAPPGSGDDGSGIKYESAPQTHHHQAPNGQTVASPDSGRPSHSFNPTYPTYSSVGGSTMPPIHDGMNHVSHASTHSSAITASKQDEEERNIALFGDLPDSKRRKFILVDDAQRGTRVRVRVMLDQVQMEEIPDSYRKSNSVFPRSYFDVQTASPPASPRGTRVFTSDPDDDAPVTGRTLVPVPSVDGSDIKLPKPRISRSKRTREVTLNDLGYRMSWSQGRVFAGRTLFLQRSLDAYRNKMRSTMSSAGQDVSVVAPHFDTRIGKRRWMERTKRTKRETSP